MSYSELHVDNEGHVIVYADGCCFNNGYPNAKAGVGVFFADNHPLNVSRPITGRATNDRAEIHAVIAACHQAMGAGMNKLQINTDSQNVIKYATIWSHNWIQNGWLTYSGRPVENREDIQEMLNLLSRFVVKWNYVQGHSKNYGNDRADELAKQGAAMYEIS